MTSYQCLSYFCVCILCSLTWLLFYVQCSIPQERCQLLSVFSIADSTCYTHFQLCLVRLVKKCTFVMTFDRCSVSPTQPLSVWLLVFCAQVVYFNRIIVVGLGGIPCSSSQHNSHRSVPTQPATMVSLSWELSLLIAVRSHSNNFLVGSQIC